MTATRSVREDIFSPLKSEGEDDEDYLLEMVAGMWGCKSVRLKWSVQNFVELALAMLLYPV